VAANTCINKNSDCLLLYSNMNIVEILCWCRSQASSSLCCNCDYYFCILCFTAWVHASDLHAWKL